MLSPIGVALHNRWT